MGKGTGVCLHLLLGMVALHWWSQRH